MKTKYDWVWWKHGVIYQIYPRSFYDSNDDGIGDIPGIIQKLDYIKDMGFDAVWLSPINTSPMYDFGYDISDYRDIDPVFGSQGDFDHLIDEAHKRDIRVILDLVINHTSHLHPWFLASRSSRKNPKRDWYIWRDGHRRKRPNNWRSSFGGSAWEWDEHTSQYYLHSFLPEQPDINWLNPRAREAVFNEVRFWLDRGVDGFRLDVVNWFVKDRLFRNNPCILFFDYIQKHIYDRNRAENHEIFRDLRKLLNSYPDRFSVGEVFTLPPGNPNLSARFLGNGEDELHLAFDFSLIYRLWNARRYYRAIKRWMKSIPEKGWPCHVLSNHDQSRSISRLGNGKDADKRAYVAAALLLTLKGTPFVYYGEEVGMKNVKLSRKNIQDPLGKRFWPFYSGRDQARSPMQWNGGKNAGFTNGIMWLPIGSDYRKANVSSQIKDSYSLLNWYKRLIAARKKHRALYMGEWKPVLKGRRGVLAYFRKNDEETVLVVLNFTSRKKEIRLNRKAQWKVLLSTHRHVNCHLSALDFQLQPYEATLLVKIGELK